MGMSSQKSCDSNSRFVSWNRDIVLCKYSIKQTLAQLEIKVEGFIEVRVTHTKKASIITMLAFILYRLVLQINSRLFRFWLRGIIQQHFGNSLVNNLNPLFRRILISDGIGHRATPDQLSGFSINHI